MRHNEIAAAPATGTAAEKSNRHHAADDAILPRPAQPVTAEAHPGRVDASWWTAAQRAISWLAADGLEFTTADLVALGVPAPADPNWWGASISAAAARGTITPCGTTRVVRPGNSPYVVQVWSGARAVQARCVS